jgi:hypothetical protein
MKKLLIKQNYLTVSVLILLVLSVYSQARNPVSLSMSVKPAKVPAGGKMIYDQPSVN